MGAVPGIEAVEYHQARGIDPLRIAIRAAGDEQGTRAICRRPQEGLLGALRFGGGTDYLVRVIAGKRFTLAHGPGREPESAVPRRQQAGVQLAGVFDQVPHNMMVTGNGDRRTGPGIHGIPAAVHSTASDFPCRSRIHPMICPASLMPQAQL